MHWTSVRIEVSRATSSRLAHGCPREGRGMQTIAKPPRRATTPPRRLCPTQCPSLLAGRLENPSSSKIRFDRQRRPKSTGPSTKKKRKIQRSRGRQSSLKCRHPLDPGNTQTSALIHTEG